MKGEKMKKAMTVIALFVLLTSLAIAESQEVRVQQLQVQPVLSGTDSPMINPATKSRDMTQVYFEDFETGATDWTAWDATATPPVWHIDTYNAYGGSGMSWWMGDPDIEPNGGYLDHWYQVLDTPPITIPDHADNLLSFQQFRAIEALGTSGNFDGWDGFNVRIRLATEEYSEAEVLTNCTPAYNSTSMYSFGFEHGECPTGIPGIPGWGGSTSGWQATNITIPSNWNGETVIISFAFASDPAQCTTDDPTLIGVFVDNIALASFYNTGDDATGFDMFSNVPEGGQLWHIYDDASAPSPTHAAGCFDPGTGFYNPDMDDYYITPEFDLPANVDITWDMYVQTDLDDGVFPDCDYLYVEVRHDDGAGWSGWWSVSNPLGDPGGDNYVFTGSIADWSLFSAGWSGYSDISCLAGMTVQFRVGLHSNSDPVTTWGFHVDNFEVLATIDVLPPTNLIADYNEQTAFVDLDWDAPVGGGGDMQWDDGTFENAISFTTGSGIMGASFPVGGQCQILEFTVFSENLAGPTTIGVYEKEGASYSSTPSYTMGVTTQAGAAATYDVSAMHWDVQNSFILGFECSSTVDCALDESTVPSEHSYVNTGGAWATWADVAAANSLPDGEWGIRCSTTYATVDPPNSYNVYRGLESGNYDDTPVGNTADTLFTDETVEAGNTYYYVVTAVYDAGESQYSNEASAFVEIASAVEYAYDDGTSEMGYSAGSAASQLAVRITPDQYPVKLIRIKYYLTEVNQQLIVYAWDDDGPGGQPGTQLIDPIYMIPSANLVANDWNVVSLPDDARYNIVINDGDFYVGWFEASNSSLIGVDTNGPSYFRSWQYTSGTWFDYTMGIPQNMMIRAVVDTNVIVSNDDEPVVGTYLLQNYPNPVKGSTQIKYGIQNHHGPVEIDIYNILGQKVDSIEGESGVATWNPGELPSGIYFYKLDTAEFTQTRKMLLIK
ncbi:MAG: T9SS type A sorting domain-containing protein [Candidatus Cloacimonetes bacterium]|nr:T9SS type A sorting domain-containing protein [Candidatus Cloacimonadota bacterium]